MAVALRRGVLQSIMGVRTKEASMASVCSNCEKRNGDGGHQVMRQALLNLMDSLAHADGQMRMAAECIQAGRRDEALMHVQAMAGARADALRIGEASKAEAEQLEQALKMGREARLRAAGMAGLLSEILGKGALSGYGDSDLIERVKLAVADQEAACASGVEQGR